MVQDGEALETMAAYIDLNPVWAGVVKEPKDYRWCGYGEAMGGRKRARRGLCKVVGRLVDSWEEVKNPESALEEGDGLKSCEVYRCWLFGDGYVPGQGVQVRVLKKNRNRKGYSRKMVQKVKDEGWKLSRGQLLRCRVRYFSGRVALGNQDFVNEVFESNRDSFGASRKKGAKPLRELEKRVKIFSLRALRIRAVE